MSKPEYINYCEPTHQSTKDWWEKTEAIKPKVKFSDILPTESNRHQKLSRTKDVIISFSHTNPNMDAENPYLNTNAYLKEDDYAYMHTGEIRINNNIRGETSKMYFL